jgi:hypothetical protein
MEVILILNRNLKEDNLRYFIFLFDFYLLDYVYWEGNLLNLLNLFSGTKLCFIPFYMELDLNRELGLFFNLDFLNFVVRYQHFKDLIMFVRW